MEMARTSTALSDHDIRLRGEGPIMDRIMGLILAGGRARRLGGGGKALLEVGGRPMLARVIAAMMPQVGCLVLNANEDAARLASWGLPIVGDAAPDQGPLAGLLAGMEHAHAHLPGVTHVLTVPVDAPLLPADLGNRLAMALAQGDATIAVAQSGGRLHHVVALWPVALRPDLQVALHRGVRRVAAFAAEHGHCAVDWPVKPFDPFMNVNTPENLSDIESMLSKGSSKG
jgi:molybdopterin-guanine dinucleotide biosynthesis protein A